MTRLQHVETLFSDVILLPPQERIPWLEAHCSDRSVREEVAKLLYARERMHRAAAEPQSPDARVATRIPTSAFGPYRALELIGRGGMSSVYLAERADGQFHQIVAVKVMAGYLADPEFLRRFETERQFLASLAHSHITRLIDGVISSSGEPFLVTEYVEGQPIDRYCEARKLHLRGRLKIFLQVCDAVDYTHRNLIVHRDLKPANILVDAAIFVAGMAGSALYSFHQRDLARNEEIAATSSNAFLVSLLNGSTGLGKKATLEEFTYASAQA